jgi:hypothetical protein
MAFKEALEILPAASIAAGNSSIYDAFDLDPATLCAGYTCP